MRHLVSSSHVATRQFLEGWWLRLLTSSQAITSVSSYVEKVSNLFMDIGRSVPRCEALASLYPRCAQLRSSLTEYLIVVVKLCHQLLKFTQKSSFQQFTSALRDSELGTFKSELSRCSKLLDERVTVLMAVTIETEARKSSRFRDFSTKQAKQMIRQQEQATRTRILRFCSRYDHVTTWKQTRKIGNSVVFKQSFEYKEWRGRLESCTLLCKGTLGSGKSVLLANIVDDLHIFTQNKNTTIAYFFCRYDIPDSLKARTILGSLAKQLLSTVPDLAAVTQADDENVSIEDLDAVLNILHQAFPSKPRAYFVLDGLDECDCSERQALAQSMQRLQQEFNILLCISCRLEPNKEIEAIIGRFAAPHNSFVLNDNSDIQSYIETELSNRLECHDLVIRDPTLILDIQDSLLNGSQGMFLWVALQIQSLCAMETDRAIRDALADLPKDLAETFTRILHRSKGKGQSYQTKILRLIAVAQRPLTTGDLQEALSVIPGNITWDPSQILNDIHSVLACCGCLLIIDEEESTVRFVHHSVKKFVLNTTHDFSDILSATVCAHRTMIDIVITYLSYGIFGTQVSTTKVPQVMTQAVPTRIIRAATAPSKLTQNIALKLLKSRTQPNFDISKTLAEARPPSLAPEDEFCFYRYASSYWLDHVTALPEQTPVIDKLLSGILNGTKLSTAITDDDHRALLWWATRVGHKKTVQMFLQARTISHDLTPRESLVVLHLWAKDNKQNTIAELLLPENVETDKLSDKLGNALHAASRFGSEQVVRLLINNHANVNPGDRTFDPLQAASFYGHEQIVRLLIEAGADVNAVKHGEGNALQRASLCGHTQIVKILLERGADANAQGGVQGSALHAASRQGHLAIVQALIERGADVNAPGERDGNALFAASEQAHSHIVNVLLDAGADVNAENESCGTALQVACWKGDDAMVKLLIARGANVNQQCAPSGHALHDASYQGHVRIVQLLLDAGADINAHSQDYASALQAAGYSGHAQTVQLLLDVGADTNVQGGEYGSVLHAASRKGHAHVVRLLLDRGVDVNMQSKDHYTALQAASSEGRVDVVQLLIERGACVNDAKGGRYSSALRAAVVGKHSQVAKMLIDHGALEESSQAYLEDRVSVSELRRK
jgi:ankyrin repeat protein